MDFLISLLPNDFFIKFQFMCNYSNLSIYTFLNELENLHNMNIEKIKLIDILKIIHPEYHDKIDSVASDSIKEQKIYEEIPFLLFEEVSINPYNEHVYSFINNFYYKYLNQKINNDFIIGVKLEEYINIENNSKLIELIINFKASQLFEISNSLLDEISDNFYNKHLDNKDIDKIFKHVQNRLFIFFKIVGKDFVNLINSTLKSVDLPSLKFAKFNSKYINKLRLELYEIEHIEPILYEGIKNKDTCILLFLICFRFENEDSLLEIFSKTFINKKELYKNRCIKLSKTQY
tara:strand:- start:709 stop:1578 length:870 start_codon:yes stop_codon:yes gene_type:complete